MLESKAETGTRVEEGGFLPGESWHTRRWSVMHADELELEWRANSHRRGHLDVGGTRRRLVRDDRLRQVVRLARRHG